MPAKTPDKAALRSRKSALPRGEAPPSIVTAGYAPLDIVRFRENRWYSAGGTAGNVAAILGFLGWSSSLVADYGDDAAARRITQDLQAANVSLQYVRLRASAVTPRLVHDIDPTGHRFTFRCPDCQRGFPMSRPLTLARAQEVIERTPKADVFLFDRCNAGTLLLAEYFSARGSLVVYEPSRPARPEWQDRALKAADIVKCASDRDGGLADVVPRPKQTWILTHGAAGISYCYGSSSSQRSPAFHYPVIDTAGAGDWTTAGVIHALAGRAPGRKAELTQALHWAQALAAVSCGSPGARGLARQQSAEAVVRAAQFVQARQGTPAPTHSPSTRKSSTPRDVCKFCLQPQIAKRSEWEQAAG